MTSSMAGWALRRVDPAAWRTSRLVRNAVRAAVLLVSALAFMACAAAAPATHVVVIEGMRFVPETLMLHRGDTVVWRNRDLVPHTVTAAGVLDSGSLAAQASWRRVITRTGKLRYVCTFHPSMTATLEVR